MNSGKYRHGRAFGVEIEMTYPDGGYLADGLTDAGLRVMTDEEYIGTDGHAKRWHVKHDGSVNGEAVELASPILRGSRGLDDLRTVCGVLRTAGAVVDASCGLHVHHDIRDTPTAAAVRQVLSFLEVQDTVMAMVAPSRRSNGYCGKWTTQDVAQFKSAVARGGGESPLMYGPRGAINSHNAGGSGTLEIRCHGGTTSYDKISAWVRFGQALLAADLSARETNDDIRSPASALVGYLAARYPYILDADDVPILTRFTDGMTDAEDNESDTPAECLNCGAWTAECTCNEYDDDAEMPDDDGDGREYCASCRGYH